MITEPGLWETGDAVCEEGKPNFSGKGMHVREESILHDMEAAAIYFAGSYFFSPHQMHFLKVVSDHGDGKVNAERLSGIMEEKASLLVEYLEMLFAYEAEKESQGKGDVKTQSEDTAKKSGFSLEKIYEELHCSESMKHSVFQLVKYCRSAHIDYEKEFREMRDFGELPCRDRREGKRVLDRLKKKLLGF